MVRFLGMIHPQLVPKRVFVISMSRDLTCDIIKTNKKNSIKLGIQPDRIINMASSAFWQFAQLLKYNIYLTLGSDDAVYQFNRLLIYYKYTCLSIFCKKLK